MPKHFEVQHYSLGKYLGLLPVFPAVAVQENSPQGQTSQWAEILHDSPSITVKLLVQLERNLTSGTCPEVFL